MRYGGAAAGAGVLRRYVTTAISRCKNVAQTGGVQQDNLL
jgi:hypothetical protein